MLALKKILFIFGTRPEAIKMAPLVKACQEEPSFDTKICITSQHREMLDQVMDFFDLTADYDLNLMRPGQNLFGLTALIINNLKEILDEAQPDYIFVHGDTTTSMTAALCGFYADVKVGHVEAGLRTFDKKAPFPEEINRQITGRIADYHFSPTPLSKTNLLKENIAEDQILVTGNTVIDALHLSLEKIKTKGEDAFAHLKAQIDFSKRIVLITGHRRENHGQGIINICEALKEIAEDQTIELVYPVHLNPKVLGPVHELLADIPNIKLIEPLPYEAFVWLMNEAYLVITDSGGIQEEAPALGKPVLVMRETTERPEAVDAGTVILVGTNKEKIITEARQLLNDNEKYKLMSQLHNPYGDGKASARIVEFIKQIK